MHKKSFSEKKNREKYKFLTVIVFFLLCGGIYSFCVEKDVIQMGTAITAEEFGKPTGKQEEDQTEKIDLNQAAAEELIRLPGIGEKRAADIIAYREENGNFSRTEEIMNVSGIGEKVYEEIKEQIVIGE